MLRVQEDAEAHCTATFRAPELFDVPTGRQVREEVCTRGLTLQG